MKDLAGRTALVTGASQGIGLACAQALAQAGADVVIMGRREAALAEARAAIVALAPERVVHIAVGDAVEEADVKAALALAHGISGRLDILVPAVGDPVFTPMLMRDVADVRRELDVNFLSSFIAVRHGVPLMQRGGAIVCISSVVTVQTIYGLSVYAAAKAALERFVRAAAYELGPAGIRINAVRPGATLPPERAALPEFAKMRAFFTANTPMRRLGVPADIARVVRFLAGPESGWVTGQSFSADGGVDQNNGPDFMDDFHGKEAMDRIRAAQPLD